MTREERRAYDKAHRERLKAEGRCVICGNPLENLNYTECENCKEKKKIDNKARYERLKTKGVCVCCGKPLDTNTLKCKACKVKTAERNKENYEALKRMKICPHCGKNEIYEGENICLECLQKARDWRAKNKDSQEYKQKKSKQDKKRYEERKAAGLCPICGKRKPTNGKVACEVCGKKRAADNRRRAREKSGDYLERSERADYGMCYVCGKPLDREGRMCEECAEKARKNIAYGRSCRKSSKEHPWSKMNSEIYKKRS